MFARRKNSLASGVSGTTSRKSRAKECPFRATRLEKTHLRTRCQLSSKKPSLVLLTTSSEPHRVCHWFGPSQTLFDFAIREFPTELLALLPKIKRSWRHAHIQGLTSPGQRNNIADRCVSQSTEFAWVACLHHHGTSVHHVSPCIEQVGSSSLQNRQRD